MDPVQCLPAVISDGCTEPPPHAVDPTGSKMACGSSWVVAGCLISTSSLLLDDELMTMMVRRWSWQTCGGGWMFGGGWLEAGIKGGGGG